MKRLFEVFDTTPDEAAPHWRLNVVDSVPLQIENIQHEPIQENDVHVDTQNLDALNEEAGDVYFLSDVTQQIQNGEQRDDGSEKDHGEDPTIDVVYGLLTCNNGMGLSKEDMNRMLAMLHKFTPDSSKIKVRTADQVEKYMSDFQRRVFGEEVKSQIDNFFFFFILKLASFQSIVTAEVGSESDPTIFTYKDSWKCLKIMIHENYDNADFLKEAETVHNDSGERIYSTPNTGLWWQQCEVNLTLVVKIKNVF